MAGERQFRLSAGAPQSGGLCAKPAVIGLLCALNSRQRMSVAKELAEVGDSNSRYGFRYFSDAAKAKPIISYSTAGDLSNNIDQKGLAFSRDWSGSVVKFQGAEGALRSCPAGLVAEVGLRWCGAMPCNRMRISMSKSVRKRASQAAHAQAETTKPSPRAIPARSKSGASGSKQSRVIAMLQSPAGATIAAIMKATEWQQHSVRGFLAGVVRKRLKLKLDSRKIDGDRVYRVVDPESRKPAPRKSKRPLS